MAVGLAQAPEQSALAFEVASVEPSPPGSQGISISGLEPSQFTTRNAPLGRILVFAYGLRDLQQIVSGPAWLRSEGFDIVAKYPSGHSVSHRLAQLPLMVQTLLVDRFTLRAHIETREEPIYILKVARSDRRLGPNLRQTDVDCAALITAGQTPRPVAGERPLCTARQSLQGRTRIIWASAMPIKALAEMLASAAERDVVEQTSLVGAFDAELQWTHDVHASPLDRRDTTLVGDGVSLFSAVQQQLGLKLEPARGPVEVLVIDSVERPTPD